MTRDEVLKLAREARFVFDGRDWVCAAPVFAFERFAALVAAAERIKHQSEIQRLTALANTAEKWRGIAMARDGDGRTVQQVQAEARADEREACAKLCEDDDHDCETGKSCAAAIRARGSHA